MAWDLGNIYENYIQYRYSPRCEEKEILKNYVEILVVELDNVFAELNIGDIFCIHHKESHIYQYE